MSLVYRSVMDDRTVSMDRPDTLDSNSVLFVPVDRSGVSEWKELDGGSVPERVRVTTARHLLPLGVTTPIHSFSKPIGSTPPLKSKCSAKLNKFLLHRL